MTIRPEEVTAVLQQELEAYKNKLKLEGIGTILQVGDGIARIYGLDDCMAGELLEFPGGVMGLALNLEQNSIGAVILGSDHGLKDGDQVKRTGKIAQVPVGMALLGRVVDALGRPLDGKGPVATETWVPLHRTAPSPMGRLRITDPLATGIRAIDGLMTVGRGQRMGIFSGSGVGKSVLMGMICRNTEAPLNVVALIGERGREVREFVERDLGPEGLARSVVVVATGEQSPVLRVRAALAATAVAEHFRDQGQDVLLMMDSVTRIAYAQREIGLSAGEPPATKGYPPSVYALLPRILERAGRAEKGSITGL